LCFAQIHISRLFYEGLFLALVVNRPKIRGIRGALHNDASTCWSLPSAKVSALIEKGTP